MGEEEKLVKFKDIEKQYELQEEQCRQKISMISEAFDNYRKIYEDYVSVINDSPELSDGDLEFSMSMPFKTKAFSECLLSIYDKRSIKRECEWIDFDNFDVAQFLDEEHLRQLIEKTLSKKLVIKQGKLPEIALREIFDDWYNLCYQVAMDGDEIGQMSPGKKALVLLKLLINLAESTCPILIDQPEDDLDNRSIFGELIPFIRKKKIERQIIIVTHNANVVLGGDAEEVIIANKEGNDAKNKRYKFEYRSGSIEDNEPINSEAKDTLGKKGIQQHICEILEGGEVAFALRRNKYRI